MCSIIARGILKRGSPNGHHKMSADTSECVCGQPNQPAVNLKFGPWAMTDSRLADQEKKEMCEKRGLEGALQDFRLSKHGPGISFVDDRLLFFKGILVSSVDQ